jgi:hypothetical protein
MVQAMNQHKRLAQGDKNIGFKSGGAVKKDVETKAEMKKYGKEGSKSEERHDKTEMAWGGRVAPKMARPIAPPVAMQRPMAMPTGMKKGGSAKGCK